MGEAESVVGPIDFVLPEFPDQEPSGEAPAALMDLVEAGIVNLYDLLIVRKAADGSLSASEFSSAGAGDGAGFASFAGARSGLLGDDDLDEAAAAMEPGTIGVMLVYENAWAGLFVAAARRAGGEMIATARIPAQDVLDALDALEISE
jgi:hypothetical protein